MRLIAFHGALVGIVVGHIAACSDSTNRPASDAGTPDSDGTVVPADSRPRPDSRPEPGCGDRCRADQICVASECACPDGLDDCDSQCVDTDTDLQHCGSCGATCASGCVAGECTCAAPESCCDGAPVDLLSDPTHCGACGTVCPSLTSCVRGECVCSGPGLEICGGECTDTLADEDNCGACGFACRSFVSRVCEDGACVCTRPCGASDCCAVDDTCVRVAPDLELCRAPLRVECELGPSGRVYLGDAPVRCRALRVTADGVEIDVTTDPQTTWALGPCRDFGSGLPISCTTSWATLETAGPGAGTLTPPPHACPPWMATAFQQVDATWSDGTTTLSASGTVELWSPVLSEYPELRPIAHSAIPALFDPRCRGAGVDPSGGLSVRLWGELPTLSGARCPIFPLDRYSTDFATRDLVDIAVLSDGSALLTVSSAAAALTEPRVVNIEAYRGPGAVVSVPVTLVPASELDRVRLEPSGASIALGATTSPVRAWADFGTLAFEITHLGRREAHAGGDLTYPVQWDCSGATDPSRATPLYPWTEAECPNTLGAESTGPFPCAGSAVPSTTALVELIGGGTFRAVAATGSAGARTLTLAFPYAGAPAAVTTPFTLAIGP